MHFRTTDTEIVSNPVFIPKRMQNKPSIVCNEKNKKFKKREISVNNTKSPLFSTNNFKSKPITGNRLRDHMIPVRAEVHRQNSVSGNQSNQSEIPEMTAIKGILKTRTGDCVSNGEIRHKRNELIGKAIINVNKLTHKTHNQSQDFNIANTINCGINSGSTPSARRKSSSVQFDFNNIKESTKIQLNSNYVSLITTLTINLIAFILYFLLNKSFICFLQNV